MTIKPPVKGTVWKHARRTDYKGDPLVLTVTSFTQGKVYSVTPYHTKVKTPLGSFPALCKEIVSTPEPVEKVQSPRLTERQCETLYVAAHRAGLAAGELHNPIPMTVVQRANPLDDTSAIVRQYAPIMDGVCGFAYVTVRPGNSSFARYLKAKRGGFKAYYGGTQISVHEFGQSYERKCAYASAFVRVLTDAGIQAYVDSRLD